MLGLCTASCISKDTQERRVRKVATKEMEFEIEFESRGRVWIAGRNKAVQPRRINRNVFLHPN